MVESQVLDSKLDQIQQNFFDLQRRFERIPYPALAYRILKLKKLKNKLLQYRQDIIESVYKDFSKPYFETETSELVICLREINLAIKNLKFWAQSKRVDTDELLLGSSSYVQSIPRGVVLIISPCNYPINLSISPLISAFAAGNTILIKPSEITEYSSRVIEKIISDTFDQDEVKVVLGGPEVANALTLMPFNFIFFTGSSNTAKLVLQNAAMNLTPVALELGGKSPVIIEPKFPLKNIVKQILFGKLLNAGQTCIAPDFVCIHSSQRHEFESLWNLELEMFYGKDVVSNPDYCGIVNERHFEFLRELYNDAIAYGAESCNVDIFDNKLRKISPILLKNVAWDNPVMCSEIFGPILPMITYENTDEIFQNLNKMKRPLSLYLYSYQKSFREKIIQNTRSGGLSINMCLLHYCEVNLPFGGDHHSGWGRYHGHSGYLEFSHQKSVSRQSLFPSSISLFYPPYRGITQRLKDILIKILS